jgi:hypothetical protein
MSNSQERRRLARQLRIATRADRQRNRARRRVATLTPQPARVWLVNAGVDTEFADRYASAFSRGMTPTQMSVTKIKPKKNSRKSERTVAVKLYNFATFVGRLTVYRPKNNPEAAAEFARAAALVS